MKIFPKVNVTFLPCDNMLACCVMCCLLQAGVLSEWLNVSCAKNAVLSYHYGIVCVITCLALVKFAAFDK